MNTQNQVVDPINHIYQYDADGELTADGSHTYTYDSDNRLLKVDGGNTATYTYDALGHRVQKTVGSAPTSYVYDLSGNVVAEVNNVCASICWAVFYANLNGQLIAEYKNLTTYFFHGDHLGSTRLVTGVNQAVVQNLDYFPFGELNSADSGISTHKFTGDERDSETSLDHTQFRQYTSQLARWITPDPAGLAAVDPTNPQSWNRYAYVTNNPMSFRDPLGLLLAGPGGCNLIDGCGGGGPVDNSGGGFCDASGNCGTGTGVDGIAGVNGIPWSWGPGYNISSTSGAAALLTGQAHYLNWLAQWQSESQNPAPGASPADETIVVHCDEFDLLDISCDPPPQAVPGSRAWYSPGYSADEARLATIGGGVVKGAGVIGDPRYIAGFYLVSAALGDVVAGGQGTIAIYYTVKQAAGSIFTTYWTETSVKNGVDFTIGFFAAPGTQVPNTPAGWAGRVSGSLWRNF